MLLSVRVRRLEQNRHNGRVSVRSAASKLRKQAGETLRKSAVSCNRFPEWLTTGKSCDFETTLSSPFFKLKTHIATFCYLPRCGRAILVVQYLKTGIHPSLPSNCLSGRDCLKLTTQKRNFDQRRHFSSRLFTTLLTPQSFQQKEESRTDSIESLAAIRFYAKTMIIAVSL